MELQPQNSHIPPHMITVTTTDLQTQTATHLSMVELGLGSFLHAFKIPFTGHFLSLNQSFFLTYCVRILSPFTEKNRFQLAQISFEISILTALLKSLSPAGQKWGPMLSISMQGILYSLGLILFGANIVGAIVGSVLLSTWAFIQPFITLFISFGPSEIHKIIGFYTQRLQDDFNVQPEQLKTIVLAAILLKAFLAALVCLVAYFLKSQKVKKLQEKLISHHKQSPRNTNEITTTIHKKVFRDLTRPLFLFSFVLATVFLFATETEFVSVFWKILRPLGIAVLAFYFMRSSLSRTLIEKLVSKSEYLKKIYQKSQTVFNELN